MVGKSIPRLLLRTRRKSLTLVAVLSLTVLMFGGSSVNAQSVEVAPDAISIPGAEPLVRMPVDEARKALAEKDDAGLTVEARIALLERQRAAAFSIGDRGSLIAALEALARLYGSGPKWRGVMASLQGNVYYFSGARKSIDIGERLLADDGLPLAMRAAVASMLTYSYSNSNQLEKAVSTLALTERAYAALGPNGGGSLGLQRGMLTTRADVARALGDLDGSTGFAREGYLLGLREVDQVLLAERGNRDSVRFKYVLDAANGAGGVYAYALVRQGRLAEAKAVCEAGLARTRLLDPRASSTGAWHTRLANIHLSERRFDDALKAARNALSVREQTGAEAGGTNVSMPKDHEIMALIGLQRWAEADQLYNAHLGELQGDKIAANRFADLRMQALLAAKNGRPEAGLEMIERAYRYRVRLYGPKHPNSLESQGLRGSIRLLNGSYAAALADYEGLFSAILDNPSAWVELEPVGRSGAYLGVVIDDFLRYVATKSREGSGLREGRLVDRATQLLDWLTISATQQAINDSTARLHSGSPELLTALRELQQARNDSRDRYRDLSASYLIDPKKLTEDGRMEYAARLKRDLDAALAAREKVEKINLTMTGTFPSYADLIQPRTLPPDEIAKLLNRNELLITIVPTRFAVFVSAINADGWRQLHASTWTEAELDRRVAAFRRLLDIGALAEDRVPRFDFELAHELYRELLSPFEAMMPAGGALVVAANGSLASVPIGALVTAASSDFKSAAWLVRKMTVTQVPSPSTLAALRRGSASKSGDKAMLGFGDPHFGGDVGETRPVRQLTTGAAAPRASSYSLERGFRYAAMPALPDTRDELTVIARSLGADPALDLKLGTEATREAVMRANFSGRRVVAFATHGLQPGEMPGVSKPALAMAATEDPGGPLLILDDILSLKMNPDWVVLSACNTAGGERGGTAMSGLVRGFFFAGSRSVLATHWAVDSVASRELVTAVFKNYSGSAGATPKDRASSLRAAQLAMIDGQLGEAKYAHPFYWAPYALFGDPAR